jgi:hypothetical protein
VKNRKEEQERNEICKDEFDKIMEKRCIEEKIK